jgi:polyisoprenoid-binding protein YceI/cytochrome b561
LAQFHKSVGITILLLSVLRVAIRLTQPRPALFADDALSLKLAHTVHAGLYLFMIVVPVSGWVLVSTSSRKIDTVLFNVVAWPHVPGLSGLSETVKGSVHEAAEWLHGSLTWFGIALFVLHVAGALRHQYAKGDPLLSRILPVRGADRKAAGSAMIAALAVAAAGLLFAGQNFHLAPSAVLSAAPGPEVADVPEQGSFGVSPLAKEASEDQVSTEQMEPESVDAEAGNLSAENESESSLIGSGIPAGTAPAWAISSNRYLGFVAKWGDEDIRGTFSRWDGTVRFNPDALGKSSVRIVVDLASASTADPDRDQMLQGGEFFATSSVASATFTSTSFSRLSGSRYQANGTLTLKGVSKPQTLIFTLDIDGKKAIVSGTAAVSRLAFNVGEGDYDMIADTVQVRFNFEATR